jgi:hypothetical protein
MRVHEVPAALYSFMGIRRFFEEQLTLCPVPVVCIQRRQEFPGRGGCFGLIRNRGVKRGSYVLPSMCSTRTMPRYKPIFSQPFYLRASDSLHKFKGFLYFLIDLIITLVQAIFIGRCFAALKGAQDFQVHF